MGRICTQLLTKVDKESGEPMHYNGELKSVSLYGQKYFEDIVIGRENKKVYLRYDIDYIIELKTDSVLPVEN